MKKILVFLLSLSFALSGVVLPNDISVFATETTTETQADTTTDETENTESLWEYELYGDGIMLTKYNGTQIDVYIPSSIEIDSENVPVLKLGDDVFKNNTAINSVTLGAGIKVIGKSAFENATNLVCIVTTEDLTTIEDNAFSGCTAFNSIILYDAVSSIEENTFLNCPKLTIYCNENTTAYNYAVDNSIPYIILNPNATLETVTVDGIEYYIQNGEAIAVSFDNLSTEVIVPAMVQNYPVTSIKNIFEKSSIVSITLPNTIRKLEENAFSGCTGLLKIDLPDSIMSIASYAFSGCTGLTACVIPEGVKSIPMGMFSGCTGLKTVSMPNSITKIYQYAFSNCWYLTTITIPENVTEIWHGAFQWCTRLNKIYWNAKNVEDSDSDDKIFFDAGTNGNGIDVIFGGTVERIPACIFSSSYAPYLKSVTFSNSIKSVGANAFASCYDIQNVYIQDLSSWCNITFDSSNANPVYYAENVYLNNEIACEIVLPNDLIKINDYAFYNWKTLTDITLPQSIISIGNSAFQGCVSLTNITFPNTINSIGNNAFSGCKSLTDIVLPNSITSIGNGVFTGCTGIKNITLPNNIAVIPSASFSGCSGLTNVSIPDTVTKIGASAFLGCGLTNINLPVSINSIGARAFYRCTKLTEIEIPDTVLIIADDTFSNCSSLEKITIPDSITSIGNNSFYNCTGLDFVTIPESVTTMSATSFPQNTILGVFESSYAHTFSLENELLYYITTGNDEPIITKLEGVSYLITNTEAIAISFDGTTESVVIPDYLNTYPVTSIRTIFKDSNITSITLPDTMLKLTDNAFSNCKNLTSITLPNSVISIGIGAFKGCTKLTEVAIPDSVSAIGNNCFYNCSSLEKIIIPDSVTSIGDNSFYNCTSLDFVTIPESVSSMSTSSFHKETILGVFEDSYAHSFALENDLLYYITTGNDTPILTTLNGITYLITNTEAIAISFDGSIETVIVPAYVNNYPVTSIQTTFKGSDITSIILPETISEIPKIAFDQCKSLTSITLSDSTISIGNYAFRGCLALKNITIPDKVNYIGDSAFSNCRSLMSITIPKTVTYVGSNAFSYCYVLEEINWNAVSLSNTPSAPFAYAGKNGNGIKVVFGEGVKSIPANIFGSSSSSSTCPKTISVTIPDSVISIGDDAFKFNISLKDLYIENVAAWCNISFGTFYSNPISRANNLYINNEKVTEIVIPNTVKTIKKYAFYETLIAKITIPDSVTRIEAMAFNGSSVKNLTIPKSVTYLGYSAFSGSYIENLNIMGSPTLAEGVFKNCSKLQIVNIYENLNITNYTFRYCPNISNINVLGNISQIGLYAFADSDKVKTLRIPASVSSMSTSAFPISTILIVDENSYAHTFAQKNNLLYFVIQKTENPEIAYGAEISGTVTADGEAVSGATVEILYDDGTVKESVVTDENGTYTFTYAEVGRYTIKTTDESGNTGSEQVFVKRMNVFDVFLAGETDLVLKTAWTVSGTLTPAGSATVTLTDTDGNTIQSVETTDGNYTFQNVPNGTYLIKAETENGSTVKEITVFNNNVLVETIVINSQVAAITGYVEVEDREFNHHRRNWVQITVYNSEGIAVAQDKSDKDGAYYFDNLPFDDYSIVAETSEMRPDKHKHFDRSHTLTGYAYISLEEAKTYTVETIILYEENDHLAEISGKVTAQGENQACEVILKNVFKHEIAKCNTGKNGKYTFKNVKDGLYFITAVTQSNGMGFAVVMVRNGHVYGDTDIKVTKSDRVKEHEDRMRNDIPECKNHNDALAHKDKIAEHKKFYDSLPEKEKKQFSKAYIDRLNYLSELISNCNYESNEGTIQNGGMIISGDEIDNEETVKFVLTVNSHTACEIGEDGITTNEQFIQQSIHDTADDRTIAKYYDIILTKNGKNIKSVHNQTDTTGKLRITMDIPEEYRGHKHYSFVHVHNGIPQNLVDLDDNPDTVTFEIDRFSTFALTYTNTELSEASEDLYPASISYSDGKITVTSEKTAKLYIATYGEDLRVIKIEAFDVTDQTPAIFDFSQNQKAFVWDKNFTPLCEVFSL